MVFCKEQYKDKLKASKALKIARKYYDDKTLEHVSMVAAYVAENETIPEQYMEDCISLAYLHDLLKDTNFKLTEQFENYFEEALVLITKTKEMGYDDYCKRIKDNIEHISGKLAYWVKIADIKDHLTRTDTLTDNLKEMYLSGLRFLL